MKKYLATFERHNVTYFSKTIEATSAKEAVIKAKNWCFMEKLKSVDELHNTNDEPASTPEEILKILNKLQQEYSKNHYTEQAYGLDVIIRFYLHLIALDEITEDFIRGIIE